MKTLNYFFQAIFIYFLFLIGFILGLKISKKFFSSLFRILGPIFRSEKIIDKNLSIFKKNVPVLDDAQIKKEMWENYGKTFIEYIFLKKFRYSSEHIEIIGIENLLVPSQQNKPVIFISGHFANFELMSMEITKNNINLATIYRPLNNSFLNPFMEYLRKKYVCKNQIKKGIGGVREAIEFIGKKHSIALMVDQRVSEGENVPLFGKLALTTTLPAQLSLKFNLPIIPVLIKRQKDDNFKIEFMKKISPENFSDKFKLSKRINETLEELITKNPSQWIWTHNRWKQ